MQRTLRFTPTAAAQLDSLKGKSVHAQVLKTLGFLEVDPKHPSLNTHEFTSLRGPKGEKVFEAYAQNNTPGAYRVFWQYGPDELKGKKRIAVITIIAITRHP